MKAGVHAPTYRSWQMMKNRCLNPNAMDYRYYGGRGIKVDPDWYTYEGFVAAMGLRPDGLTLDRENGNKHYVADNCRWATRQTQARNREYTVDLIFEGRVQKVWEWAAELDVKPKTMHHRLWQYDNDAITLDKVFAKRTRKAYR